MEVICLEEPAFYQLVEKVVSRLKDENNVREEPWLSTDEAMEKLKISSKTTLIKMDQAGKWQYLLNRQTDIANSSRPLNAEEIVLLRAKGTPIRTVILQRMQQLL